jgi:hypothetical protein
MKRLTLNENISRIKQVMGILNEQTSLNELGVGMALSQKPTVTGEPKLSCITFPSGADHVDVKTKTGYSLKLFTNNRFMNNSGGNMGDWACSPNNKCDITFEYDKDKDPTGRVSIKYTETMMGCGGPVKQQIQWTKETGKFPLMYGQFGPTIKTLQLALSLKGDTYFGPATEKAILSKAPEYKRATGVTQDIYNKIVNAAKPAQTTTPPTEAELQANPSTLNPY